MKDKGEILDLLENILVSYAQKVCGEVGREITLTEARNLVGKVGARITFSGSVPKKELDEIIAPTNKN